jgi:hypothetical protein
MNAADTAGISKDATTSIDKGPQPARQEDPQTGPKKAQNAHRQQGRKGARPYPKRGGADHSKVERPSSLQMQPNHTYFPIFTSNIGCRTLSTVVHRSMTTKDHRLGHIMTVEELQYATCIAWILRVATCANTLGYNIIDSYSVLKRYATGIQLPTILADYVEVTGSFELSSGATIVPHMAEYPALFQNNPLMFDPAEPLIGAHGTEMIGGWPINRQWILRYNDATLRASRSGMHFRGVNNTTLVGRAELCVGYSPVVGDAHLIQPHAPIRILETQATLGAAYRFRDWTQRNGWPGLYQELVTNTFSSRPIDPTFEIQALCVASFRGNQSY